jgi:8-oxo-dGTP pyrophosphatase MutT (NUDIX family)
MRVHEDITELPDGSPGLYGWIEKAPSAIIVACSDDGVWLVQQFRHPVGERFWEFPQGSWEDVEPASAEALARAELAEETGVRAGRLENLGRLYFAYGISNQSVDVWRATDLTLGERELEPTEQGLIAQRFPVADVERMIRSNEIKDAASVAAWHLAAPRRP